MTTTETSPAQRPRLGLMVLLVPILSGLLFFALLLGINLAIHSLLFFQGYQAKIAALTVKHIGSSFYFLQSVLVLAYLSLLFVMWCLASRSPPNAFARFSPVSRFDLIAPAGSAVLVAGGPVLAALMTTHAHAASGAHSTGQYVLFAITSAILIPPIEEMYFRGLLLSWLAQRLTRTQSALVSAALFSLVHFRFAHNSIFNACAATLADMVLGYLASQWTFKSRSLWPATVQHVVFNTIILAAL